MAEIQKGVVTQFEGGLPVVRPYGAGDALTPPLINRCVDFSLMRLATLSVGTNVVFAMFEDGTGVVLALA